MAKSVVHFDAKIFERTERVVGIELPARLVSKVLHQLGQLLYKRPNVKGVRNGSVPARKVVLLSSEKVSSLSPSKEVIQAIEKATGVPASKFSRRMMTENAEDAGKAAGEEEAGEAEVDTQWCDVKLDYKSKTVEEILSHYLPKELEVISHFETVGHIAHLNLRDGHADWRTLIGEVILAKNPHIRTVVTKVGNIKTKFRTFPMEVIAGEDNLVAQVSESGCKFAVDFRQCYWNSRLGMEHNRLVQTLHPDDVVCDMMAGIGPFAVPAAKNGCRVYANDLNPTSFEYLCKNRELNKVSADMLTAYNEDGRKFVRDLVRKGVRFTQVIMNLPASAYTFLTTFIGLFHERPDVATGTSSEGVLLQEVERAGNKQARERKRTKMKAVDEARAKPRQWAKLDKELPWIHCYGFSAAEDPKADFLALVTKTLGVESLPNCQVREVRDVAPTKRMILVSFPLPEEVAYATPPHPDALGQPSAGDKRSESPNGDADMPPAKVAKTE